MNKSLREINKLVNKEDPIQGLGKRINKAKDKRKNYQRRIINPIITLPALLIME
jgi:hypothetical protein